MSIFSQFENKICRISNRQCDYVYKYRHAKILEVSNDFIKFLDNKTGKEIVINSASVLQIFEENEEGGF